MPKFVLLRIESGGGFKYNISDFIFQPLSLKGHSMNSKILARVGIAVAILAALAAGVYYCWTIRELPNESREACKQVVKDVKGCKDVEVVPYLRKLAGEKFFKARFNDHFPWMHLSIETKVPIDFISQVAEDVFYRFAGRGTPETADAPRMKEILAFSNELYPRCSKEARISLRERQVDACFFLNDFDGAIKLIEQGLPGRSPVWVRGTVAKLRAHKAMLADDPKEVVKQLLIFDEYLHSEEMKDRDDEYDQTTGALYSTEWVMGRNYMRCSIYSRKAGDNESADKYLALAKPLFAKAREKCKDDKTTREELEREMQELKKHGL